MPTSSSESNDLERESASTSRTTDTRIRVGIADYTVTTAPGVLSTSGLGSCLGIVLYDQSTAVVGLLHAMLPEATADCTSAAKFVDAGIDRLLTEMQEAGATLETVAAKIAGGSTMLDLTTTGQSIGDRNVEATREALAVHGIPLVAEDVGGEHGRSIRFDADTFELQIKTAHQGECVI